jgi:hypothetical protein
MNRVVALIIVTLAGFNALVEAQTPLRFSSEPDG